MIYPTFKEEKKLWKKGYRSVVGIDEVGRGPLAGPVVACALVFLSKPGKRNLIKKKMNKNLPRLSFADLRDSKRLSAKQREEWYLAFQRNPNVQWGIGSVSEKTIDAINIFQATKLAMKRALERLEKKTGKADFLIIDGTFFIDSKVLQKPMRKGDELVASCAAASIMAKVTRDRMMARYHLQYPKYGFDRHKGYGTPQHLAMLEKYGPCGIHRRSFRCQRKLSC
ncbi:MAG TPA: ribonuclease HII [Candidatus Paceibacterota bacterium]